MNCFEFLPVRQGLYLFEIHYLEKAPTSRKDLFRRVSALMLTITVSRFSSQMQIIKPLRQIRRAFLQWSAHFLSLSFILVAGWSGYWYWKTIFLPNCLWGSRRRVWRSVYSAFERKSNTRENTYGLELSLTCSFGGWPRSEFSITWARRAIKRAKLVVLLRILQSHRRAIHKLVTKHENFPGAIYNCSSTACNEFRKLNGTGCQCFRTESWCIHIYEFTFQRTDIAFTPFDFKATLTMCWLFFLNTLKVESKVRARSTARSGRKKNKLGDWSS